MLGVVNGELRKLTKVAKMPKKTHYERSVSCRSRSPIKRPCDFLLVVIVISSAVFNDFTAPLQDLSWGPAGWPRIVLVSDTGQIFFKIFWLRIVHFGLVWLWYMIRQFRIYLTFFRMFVPTRSRPLARSVAHSQLRVLRGALVMSAVSRTVSNLRRLIGQKVPFNAVPSDDPLQICWRVFTEH